MKPAANGCMNGEGLAHDLDHRSLEDGHAQGHGNYHQAHAQGVEEEVACDFLKAESGYGQYRRPI